MTSDRVLSSLAQPTNYVAQAYESRTNQLEGERSQEAETQRQSDNDMLKVFEFAGDGHVNEAKHYAQLKGLQVPEEIYSNADFAKGLNLSGKFYGDDPVAAQKFTTAWMSSPGGDFNQRFTLAQQAAGVPVNPQDRDYQRKIQFEEWKLKNLPNQSGGFSLTGGQTRYDAGGNVLASQPAQPPVSRFEAGQKAYNEVAGSGLASPEQAENARLQAIQYWDEAYGQPQQPAQPVFQGRGASTGLTNADPLQASQQAIGQREGEIGVNPYQTAPLPAPAPAQQIPSGLPPGSVMIGTANGRPVYQAPNGERFIDDGNP